MAANPSTREIIDYYNFSKLDYCLYNCALTNLSMHYGIWDASTRTHKQALLNENRVLADVAHIRASDRVLDVGCGYGTSSFWLAENMGCATVGCNVSEQQVVEARGIAERRNLHDQVTFVVADFHSLPFPDCCFDVAFAIESLSHSSTQASVLAELFRVLKPGGRLVLADGYFAKRFDALTTREAAIARACFEGVHVPMLPQRDQFQEWTSRAGFTNIQWIDKTEGIMRTSLRVHRLGKALLPLGWLFRSLGLRSLHPQHMKAFIEQYNAFGSGLGVYGVFSALRP